MNRRFAAAVSVFVIAVVTAVIAAAQPPAEDKVAKEKDIRKLMQLTGAGDLGAQSFAQLLESFKTTHPTVPATFWEEFKLDVQPDELVALIIPIYDQNLTHEDIIEAIKFYESPAGQRLTGALPAISQQSVQAGQAWGQEIGNRAATKLRAQGLIQ
ncbi:MAG: DUF2059 domain-containing protein [Candidatus Hydrogenedentes bacterium]|nr:DUF2059 domain-containing protein [Candidatus Hydrogenedentota bacterium]